MKKQVVLILSLCLFMGVSGSVSALSQGTQKSKKEIPQLQKEIVKIKFVQASQIKNLLNPYLSRYGSIRFDERLQMLTLQDTPEIVDKVLAAIKKIDIRPKDLLFTVDLILGSMVEKDNDPALKADPVIKDLRNVLSYKSYKKIGSSLVRVQANNRSEQRIGGQGIDLNLWMRPRYIQDAKGGLFQLQIELRHEIPLPGAEVGKKPKDIRLFETTLTMNSGERTVVGVSKLNGGDDALILILTGKVLK